MEKKQLATPLGPRGRKRDHTDRLIKDFVLLVKRMLIDIN